MIEKKVARDGIEPPTPAFSGLDSPEAITLNLSACRRSPRTLAFWDSNGTRFSGRSNLPTLLGPDPFANFQRILRILKEMRILFDAKDLINVVEHSERMALEHFADWLSRRGQPDGAHHVFDKLLGLSASPNCY